ncbi:Extracellular globin-2C [Lamellibrachia satsuma]|nr:Extracellular globin-2C [Lamellibrachia satsuma]
MTDKGPPPYGEMDNIRFMQPGFEKLLKNINQNKAAGPDELPARILKETALELSGVLSYIFQQSSDEDTIPSDWSTRTCIGYLQEGGFGVVDSIKVPPLDGLFSCSGRSGATHSPTTPPIMRLLGITVMVACGLAVCAVSGESNFCSSADADIVIQQWQAVSSPDAAAKSKLSCGQAVFARLFDMAPGAKGLFTRVNVADTSSPEFNGHVMRVMGGLDVLVNYLHDLPVLESMLAHLSEQHVVREGVTKAGFGVMAKVLMESMPQIVENFNPDAWRNCLIPILNGMSVGLPA